MCEQGEFNRSMVRETWTVRPTHSVGLFDQGYTPDGHNIKGLS